MKVTLVLFAAAAAVMAQSVDTVSATQSGVCEPHDDHWHCPEGVAEPTTPPALVTPTGSAGSAITSAASHSHDDDDDDHDHDHAASGGSTCSPHGDHWHCPSGVAEPTTPPAAVAASASASTTGASGSAAGASASPSTPQATGVAAKAATGALAILGAVGAWIL